LTRLCKKKLEIGTLVHPDGTPGVPGWF